MTVSPGTGRCRRERREGEGRAATSRLARTAALSGLGAAAGTAGLATGSRLLDITSWVFLAAVIASIAAGAASWRRKNRP